MSDREDMESDNEQFLPASQTVEAENDQEQDAGHGAAQEASQAASGQETVQAGKNTRQKNAKGKQPAKEKQPAGPPKDPCIYCGANCAKGAIQCAVCALWAHMSCTGLSKEALKGLEVQAKEVGQAYWACRSCMNFNSKWNTQMREVSRRQDETEAKVADNSDKIEEVRRITEDLRRELREQAKKTDGLQEKMERTLDEELREREARRLNLVIHGLPEPGEHIKEPRDRMEQDKSECENLFVAMKARTRYQDVRFCRRIGEKGDAPRPLVFGVFAEGEKCHILEKAKELLHTRYVNVTIVPDMTKSQRRGEQRLRDEADHRNNQLTEEDRNKNLKWLVVGKRGEKRLIKGVEREGQRGRQERTETTNNGWNPQIHVNTGLNRGQNQQWGTDRRTGGQNWRAENGHQNNSNGRGSFGSMNRGPPPPPTSTTTGDQRQQTGAQATAAVVLVSEAVLTPTAVGRPTTTAVTTATTLKVNTTTAMAVDTTTIEAQLTETTTSTSAATATTATMEPTTAPETTVPATAPVVPPAARL